MADSWKLRIVEQDMTVFETELTRPLDLGRQRAGEPEPYALIPAAGNAASRLVIARIESGACKIIPSAPQERHRWSPISWQGRQGRWPISCKPTTCAG
jgi:hypothetical protein